MRSLQTQGSMVGSWMRITQPGRYLTGDGRVATITRIDQTRAFGKIPGHYDRTWWYAFNGEHALCPVDDLVKRLDSGDE